MAFELVRPTSYDEWLELRTTVVTASDMATILGLNKWKTVKQLVDGKDSPEFFENAYTWLGQTLEPIVVTMTNKVLGTSYRLYEDDAKSFFVDKELRLGATPDALDETTLLECKTTKPGNALDWAHWPPVHYLLQLYVQLICTEKQQGILSVASTNMSQLTPTLKLNINIHRITRTKEIDCVVLSEVKRFWDTLEAGKQFRVNRTLSSEVNIRLRLATERIYG